MAEEVKKEKVKKYYKLSERTLKSGAIKRVITIDDSVKPTDRDKADVRMYVECGYTIAHKSEKRSEAAKKRAKETGFGKKKDKEAKNEN
jgi:3-dehydroquinate synthetase